MREAELQADTELCTLLSSKVVRASVDTQVDNLLSVHRTLCTVECTDIKLLKARVTS